MEVHLPSAGRLLSSEGRQRPRGRAKEPWDPFAKVVINGVEDCHIWAHDRRIRMLLTSSYQIGQQLIWQILCGRRGSSSPIDHQHTACDLREMHDDGGGLSRCQRKLKRRR